MGETLLKTKFLYRNNFDCTAAIEYVVSIILKKTDI